MKKKSFILYAEQSEVFESLTDKQAGQLIKAIFKYINDDENYDKQLSMPLKTILIPIRQTIVRENEKWEETRKKRSEAGKRHSGNQYSRGKAEQKTNELEQNGTVRDKMKQVGTKWNKMEQNGTNGTVNVNDNVNVNGNVNVSVSGNKDVSKETSMDYNTCASAPTLAPTLSDILTFGEEKKVKKEYCERFFNYYESVGWNNVANWRAKFEYWINSEVDKSNIFEKEGKRIL